MVRSRNRAAARNESTSNQEPRTTRTRAEAPSREERQPNPTTASASSREDSAPTRTAADSSASAHTASSGNDAGGSRALAPAQTRELGGVNQRNAFEAYGQSMNMNTIVGTLIKFNKGDWITGDDEDLEEDELQLVANMDQLMVGWIKWQDNKPVEQIMGPVAEGYQAPRRNELGDQNQDEWETDQEGRPRDPWQFSNYIVLKTPGEDATEDNLYTFATSSKGGLGAIGALCREYGKEMRRRPDEYPIIKLGADTYNHATYGRTYVPIIQIVGWEAKSEFEMAASAGDASEAAQEPEAETQPQPRRAASGRSRR